MDYDDLSYDELEKEQNIKIIELNQVNKALEHLKIVIQSLSDVEYENTDNIYKNLVIEEDKLKEVKMGMEIDLDDISDQMQILEDMYDEFNERNREYWSTQFRPGEI